MTNTPTWEERVHETIQEEVVGEIWYESKHNEARLYKLLSNLEKKIISLGHRIEQEAREDERRKLLDEVRNMRAGSYTNKDREDGYQKAIAIIEQRLEARTGSKSEGVN